MDSFSDDFSPLPVPGARQINVFYDRFSYSAFPHVIRLEGDELLLAFRQAPREPDRIRHTHPRSLITVIHSFDGGETWPDDSAVQLGAGGGQEFGLIYLGGGKVGGALAAHEVAPMDAGQRAGFSNMYQHEYPFRNVGALWCWSDNYGTTWRIDRTTMVGAGVQSCAPPVRLADGDLMIPAYGAIGRSKMSSSMLYRSSDGGASWSEMVVMARGRPQTRSYCEPVVMELEPGHLLGMLRVEDDAKGPWDLFWRNESFDNGETWTAPKPTPIRSGACPRLLKLRDGRLLLTYGRRSAPHGLYASISVDQGTTWGTSWLLRLTPDGDQGYTSSIELDDGRIFTANYAKNGRGITGITGTFWQVPE